MFLESGSKDRILTCLALGSTLEIGGAHFQVYLSGHGGLALWFMPNPLPLSPWHSFRALLLGHHELSRFYYVSFGIILI